MKKQVQGGKPGVRSWLLAIGVILLVGVGTACRSSAVEDSTARPSFSRLAAEAPFRWAEHEDRLFVICMDGTWQRLSNGTNVATLYKVACMRSSVAKVLPLYLPGVGTRAGTKKLGGKKGHGYSDKVREAYAFLCEWWKPGDSIVIAGFSRGAYQARLLAGVIGTFGIYPASDSNPLRRARTDELGRLCSIYLDAPPGFDAEATRLSWMRYWDESSVAGWTPAEVDCLICFDTVASVADLVELDDVVTQDFDEVPIHHRTVPASTRTILHAMALDEKRRAFRVVPFVTEDPSDPRVRQVWFAGGHGDVGKSRLTLDWALHNLPAGVAEVLGVGAWGVQPFLHLNDDPGLFAEEPRRNVPGSELHPSVRARMEVMPGYEPPDWVRSDS